MNIGDRIPEILGIDQNGNEIKSSDYRGRKIVLYSYPKANTSGCTAEACSLQQHKSELESLGYSIIGISKDKVELQKKFADNYNLEFPLIADTETTTLQALGCWGEKVACGRHTIGILRTTYLVDEEGVIQKIFTPKEIKAYKNDMYKLLVDSLFGAAFLKSGDMSNVVLAFVMVASLLPFYVHNVFGNELFQKLIII